MTDTKDEALVRETAPLRDHDGSYIDWPAILAGGVIAAGIALVFSGFGGALGLSAVSVEPGEGSTFWGVMLFGVWMLVTLLASYFVGGYVAGRMRKRMDAADANEVRTRDGLHGLVVWALGALIGGLLLSSALVGTARLAGNALTTAAETTASVASSAFEGAGQVVGTAVDAASNLPSMEEMLPEGLQSNPMDYINSTLLRGSEMRLPEGTPQTDDPLSTETRSILFETLRTGELSASDREYLKSELAERTTLSEQQIDTRIDQAVERVEQLRANAEEAVAEAQATLEAAQQQAIEAAEAARFSAVVTAFVLTATMFIAAVAAYFGATTGGRHRDEGRIYGALTYPN